MKYLFSDDEHYHIECEAESLRKVLKEVKDRFRIIGKLRCTLTVGNLREYRLIGGSYGFALIIVV